MLRHDFVPIYRCISLTPRVVPVYDRVEEDVVEVVEEEKVEVKVVKKTKKSKLKATAEVFQPAGPSKPPVYAWQQVNGVPVVRRGQNIALHRSVAPGPGW